MMDYNRLKDAVYDIKADDGLENRVLAGIYEKTAAKGRRSVPRRLMAVCAAALTVVLAFDIIPLFNKGNHIPSPFIVNAYSLEADGRVIKKPLEPDIPSGLHFISEKTQGFIFSLQAFGDDYTRYHFDIYDEDTHDKIDAIYDSSRFFDEEDNLNIVFDPLTIIIYPNGEYTAVRIDAYSNTDDSLRASLLLEIRKVNDGYTGEIVQVKSFPVIEK